MSPPRVPHENFSRSFSRSVSAAQHEFPRSRRLSVGCPAADHLQPRREVGAVLAVSPRSCLMANRPPSRTPNDDGALLPMRTALILVLAVMAAAAVAGLLLLDGRSTAAAVLAGLGALAAG